MQTTYSRKSPAAKATSAGRKPNRKNQSTRLTSKRRGLLKGNGLLGRTGTIGAGRQTNARPFGSVLAENLPTVLEAAVGPIQKPVAQTPAPVSVVEDPAPIAIPNSESGAQTAEPERSDPDPEPKTASAERSDVRPNLVLGFVLLALSIAFLACLPAILKAVG